MSSSSVKACSLIDYFFIAHPPLGRREGEEQKKVLFYHPKTESDDVQTQNVGFCEAVVKFTDSFSPAVTDQTSSCNYHEVVTKKTVQVYCSGVEPGFLLGVSLSKEAALEHDYVLHSASMAQVLRTSYQMFRLFFGRFAAILAAETPSSTNHNPAGSSVGVAGLKDRLDYFYSRYLATLKLNIVPLLDLYAGVRFLSLDPTTFIAVETLVGELCEMFPQIEHSMLLYQDQLVWYTVSKSDLAILYRYLTQNLLPISLRAELQPETQAKKSSTSLSHHHHGTFVTGPQNLDDVSADIGKIPIVYLEDTQQNNNGDQHNSTDTSTATADSGWVGGVGDCLCAYYLLVYRSLNVTLAMFIDHRHGSSSSVGGGAAQLEPLSLQLFRRIDAILGPKLTALASRVADVYSRTRAEPTDFHYLFFNPRSLSLKSSFAHTTSVLPTMARAGTSPDASSSELFHGSLGGVPELTSSSILAAQLAPAPPSDVIRLVCQLRDDQPESTSDDDNDDEYQTGEIFSKTDGDWWICSRVSTHRRLFLIFPQRAAGLTDVSEEARRIVAEHFDGIFVDA